MLIRIRPADFVRTVGGNSEMIASRERHFVTIRKQQTRCPAHHHHPLAMFLSIPAMGRGLMSLGNNALYHHPRSLNLGQRLFFRRALRQTVKGTNRKVRRVRMVLTASSPARSWIDEVNEVEVRDECMRLRKLILACCRRDFRHAVTLQW